MNRETLAKRAKVSYGTVVRCEQRNVLPAMAEARARYLAVLGLSEVAP